jgi:N-acetylneuraminic acid mutarotase
VVGFSIGNKGYFGTGMNTSFQGTNVFYEYDPSNNMWTQKANLPSSGRAAATGFSIGNKGYLGWGWAGGNPFNNFFEYDPSANTWTSKATFAGGGRYGASGFSVNGKGYLCCGYNGNNFLQDLWEYDPGANAWTQRANLTGPVRFLAVGFSIGTKGFIATGESSFGVYLNDCWEYDIFTNSWTQRASVGGPPRRGATGFSIGNFGYIGTGYTQDSPPYKNDFWEYQPDSSISIHEFSNKNFPVKVFPNPFRTTATFEIQGMKSKTQAWELKLYDTSGKHIKNHAVTGSKFKLHREELGSGTYFYVISSEGIIYASGKLVVM